MGIDGNKPYKYVFRYLLALNYFIAPNLSTSLTREGKSGNDYTDLSLQQAQNP